MLHDLGLSAAGAALLEALQDALAHVSDADALHASLLLIDINLSTCRLEKAAGAHASAACLTHASPVADV